MLYTDADHRCMSLALQEARAAFAAGDFPVGAALVVNGQLWGTARNSLFSDARTTAHAEHNLITRYSARLRATILEAPETSIVLYSTLEPCLMCLGIAVLHRVSKIVIACPDPSGGTTGLDVVSLGTVYTHWWTQITLGLLREDAYELIIAFLKTEKFRSWKTMLREFQTMYASW